MSIKSKNNSPKEEISAIIELFSIFICLKGAKVLKILNKSPGSIYIKMADLASLRHLEKKSHETSSL